LKFLIRHPNKVIRFSLFLKFENWTASHPVLIFLKIENWTARCPILKFQKNENRMPWKGVPFGV